MSRALDEREERRGTSAIVVRRPMPRRRTTHAHSQPWQTPRGRAQLTAVTPVVADAAVAAAAAGATPLRPAMGHYAISVSIRVFQAKTRPPHII